MRPSLAHGGTDIHPLPDTREARLAGRGLRPLVAAEPGFTRGGGEPARSTVVAARAGRAGAERPSPSAQERATRDPRATRVHR
jgi:hypothetical protein